MRRVERVAWRAREQRRLAVDRDDDRVGDDAGEDRRDERVRLEVVAIEHLDGEERRAERRAEHGGHARGDAGDHEDAPLARRHAQVAADRRAERGADLHRRSFAPAGAAAAEREDRRDHLDPQHAAADDAAAVVERVDHRVAAAAARLGREAGEPAADERADRRDEQQEPRSELVRGAGADEGLALRAQDDVAGEILENRLLRVFERREEQRADEASSGSDEHGMPDGAPEQTHVERRTLGAPQGADAEPGRGRATR